MLKYKKSSLVSMAAALALLSNLAMAGYVEDARITAKLKAKYFAHPAMSALSIGVSTAEGHVKLSGRTNSSTQMNTAISIATCTEGVIDVDVNDLSVETSKHPAQDAKISAKINYELVKSNIFEEHQPSPVKINVESVNGNVYLSGNVRDSSQEATVVNTAYSIENVQSVTSFLMINGGR